MSDFSFVKDSGNKTIFPTGAQRDLPTGKGRFDLIPEYALQRLAKHFENGATKYGDNNWKKGIPLKSFIDSCFRHLNNFKGGANDEDHASAVIWNMMCLIETQEMIKKGMLPKELDNLNLENGIFYEPKSK